MKKIIGSVRFISSFLRLVKDPNRLDLVFRLADGLDQDSPQIKTMLARPATKRALAEHLPVPTIDLARLRMLPDGTLGREVARFFDDHGFDPASLYHTQGTPTSAFDRFKRHMERTHDIWHVATGFHTDPPGELGLQAFTLAQVGSMLAYTLMAAGMLHQLFVDNRDGEAMMDAIARGWRLGKTAQPLFGVDWEALYPRPLTEVRAQLGISDEALRAAAPELRAVAH